MDKWEFRCRDCDAWKYVIASAVPTECPGNPSHAFFGERIIQENVLINDGSAKELTLADYKQLRYNEIDGKTVALISAGFTYDSKTFSLSASAQMNWSELKAQESEFTWPVDVSTIDNDSYSLAQANLSAFWNAGKDAVKGHLDSGRALKKNVYDAADEAAVDAVVDNR